MTFEIIMSCLRRDNDGGVEIIPKDNNNLSKNTKCFWNSNCSNKISKEQKSRNSVLNFVLREFG